MVFGSRGLFLEGSPLLGSFIWGLVRDLRPPHPRTTDSPSGGKLASTLYHCVCLSLSVYVCFSLNVYACMSEPVPVRTTWPNCLASGGTGKELTISDFSPAALEDVPRVSGARFFGAQSVSEGRRRGIRTLEVSISVFAFGFAPELRCVCVFLFVFVFC